MTDNNEVTAVIHSVLERWEGRYRHPRLILELEDGGYEVAASVVRGIGVDLDTSGCIRDLIERGRYGAAERVLDVAGPDEGVADLLERARGDTADDVRQRAEALRRRSDWTGINAELDLDDVLAMAQEDRDEAARLLTSVELQFEQAVESIRIDLEAQVASIEDHHDDTTPHDGWRRRMYDLLEQELFPQLRQAFADEAHELDDDSPWVVPRPPPRATLGADVESVIRFLLDGDNAPPAVRSTFGHERAREIARAFKGLDESFDATAAKALADAINSALSSPSTQPPRADPESGGFEILLRSGRNAHALGRFGHDVMLWIGGSGATRPKQYEDFLTVAVGSGIERPERRRSKIAVLDTADLLRLSCCDVLPSIGLWRLCGNQWPLETFIGSGPADLARILGPSRHDRQSTLAWIVDLAGLGGVDIAGQAAFDTDLLPGALHPYLDLLDEVGAPGFPSDHDHFSTSRLDATRTSAFLGGLCDETPVTTTSLWSMLYLCGNGVADLGEPMDLETLHTFVAEQTETVDGIADKWLRGQIRNGCDSLLDVGVIEGEGDGYVIRRSTLALAACRRVPEHRVRRLTRDLVDSAQRAESELLKSIRDQLNDLHEHELRELLNQKSEAEAAGGERLPEVERRLEELRDMDKRLLDWGEFSAEEELLLIKEDLEARFGQRLFVELVTPTDPTPTPFISRAAFVLIVAELVRNAAKKADDGCEVEIAVEVDDETLRVFVTDNGEPILEDLHERIFDWAYSGAMGGGMGLSISRALVSGRLQGALELVSGSHNEWWKGPRFELRLRRRDAVDRN